MTVKLKLIKPIGENWPACVYCEVGILGIVGFLNKEQDGTLTLEDPADYLPVPPSFNSEQHALDWIQEKMLEVTGTGEKRKVKKPTDTAPELQEAMLFLLEKWGTNPWFVDIDTTKDDAGTRVVVVVDRDIYPKNNPILRQMMVDGQRVFVVISYTPKYVPNPKAE